MDIPKIGIERVSASANVAFESVLARLGLARVGNLGPRHSQEDHVRHEKQVAKLRAKEHGRANLLDERSLQVLHSQGLDPVEYSRELLHQLSMCQTPAEKVRVLVDRDALSVINNVDLWYVKDPSDSKQVQQGKLLYNELFRTLRDSTDISQQPVERDLQQTVYFLRPASPEYSEFSTLHRRRTLATFHIDPEICERRKVSVEKTMEMSVTAEFAERFGGYGFVDKDRSLIQAMIDGNIPPIKPIDTLYLLHTSSVDENE